MSNDKSSVNPVVLVVVSLVTLGLGVLIGALIWSGGPEHSASERLPASQIGNVSQGRELFVEYKCAACHSYRGRGGEDAPSLDFMKGKMTAREIADMNGRIWNHLPAMLTFFKEENIELPKFKENQMADLIAYLHGGGPAPDVSKIDMHMEGDEGGGRSEKDDGMHSEKGEDEDIGMEGKKS